MTRTALPAQLSVERPSLLGTELGFLYLIGSEYAMFSTSNDWE